LLRLFEQLELNTDTLLKKLSDQPGFSTEFIDDVTVNVTELFRDPSFWRLLRDEVIPNIRLNNKEFRILHAGCSSGEEVISMGILLRDMGIAEGVSIVATDIDPTILEKAQAATYPMK